MDEKAGMRRPALLVAGTAILLAVAGFLAACGGAEEATPQAPASPRSPAVSPATAPPVAPLPAAPSAGAPSPAPIVPADWKTYADPILGFSLRYPPDLEFTDLTGPAAAPGVNERAYEFRSRTEPGRAFTISVSSNTEGVTPQSWLLDHAACLPGTMATGSVAGQPAAFCTSQPEEIPEAAVAFPQMDKMIFIASIMPLGEFELVVASVVR